MRKLCIMAIALASTAASATTYGGTSGTGKYGSDYQYFSFTTAKTGSIGFSDLTSFSDVYLSPQFQSSWSYGLQDLLSFSASVGSNGLESYAFSTVAVAGNACTFCVTAPRAVSLNSQLPEPASWATMLLGFGVVGYGLRRRSVAFKAA